jgi:lipid-A-disaccharide synthase
MTANGKPDRAVATIFLVAAETSGDRLGAALIEALRTRLEGKVRFAGVGGADMAAAGMASLVPIEELSIMGFAALPRRVPTILRRIREVGDAVLRDKPDVLVIIDSPDFTHRVARRVRARNPSIPIVDYVSPTVWAWRPGRARAMRRYVDHLLALLPFEPEVHKQLGGPPCSYVGHPLLQQVATLRPNSEERKRQRDGDPPVLLVLPGSRRGEIRHHMDVLGETLARLQAQGMTFEPVIPTLPHLADLVAEKSAAWTVRPRLAIGDAERLAATRIARAALTKSGTSTLELALAGVPMVAFYKVSGWEAAIARRVIRVPTVILANLVIGDNVVPEFLQENCTPAQLAPAVAEILRDGAARRRQIEAFAKLDQLMAVGDLSPSQRAADLVIATMLRAV